MDLPAALSERLFLPREQGELLAAVVLGGLRFRVADELGDQNAAHFDAAIPELWAWQQTGGLAAEIDAQRLAWLTTGRESRDIALIAEVLCRLGVEPAAVDLVPDLVRAFLEQRLGAETVRRFAQVAPFLSGSEATPVPSGRAVGAAAGPPE